MALVTLEELQNPFHSVLIVGHSKTGKTYSIVTLMRWLLDVKRIEPWCDVFDLDDDGSDVFITAANEIKRPDLLKYLRVHRFINAALRRVSKEAKSSPMSAEHEYENFLDEYNHLYDLIDPATNRWITRERWAERKLSGEWMPGPAIIVVDSVTALTDRLEAFIMRKRNTDRFEFGEWNIYRDKIVEIIEAGKGLPAKAFVMCAHQDHRQEVVPGPMEPDPSRPGKMISTSIPTGQTFYVPQIMTTELRNSVTKHFSIVLFTIYEGSKYMWICRPNPKITSAGSRTAVNLPNACEQDFARVMR